MYFLVLCKTLMLIEIYVLLAEHQKMTEEAERGDSTRPPLIHNTCDRDKEPLLQGSLRANAGIREGNAKYHLVAVPIDGKWFTNTCITAISLICVWGDICLQLESSATA